MTVEPWIVTVMVVFAVACALGFVAWSISREVYVQMLSRTVDQSCSALVDIKSAINILSNRVSSHHELSRETRDELRILIHNVEAKLDTQMQMGVLLSHHRNDVSVNMHGNGNSQVNQGEDVDGGQS
jgi:hypothetical protein